MRLLTKKKAFSLIELSIIILVIGILIAGVTQGSALLYASKLKSARTLSQSSPVAGIKDLILWMDVTKEGSLINAAAASKIEEGDFIDIWRDVNPQTTNHTTFTAPASTNRPIYRETKLNGLPTLEFDGLENLANGDYLTAPEEPKTAQPANHTIFVIFTPIVGNDNSFQGIFTKFGGGGTNTPYSIIFNGDTNTVGSVTNSQNDVFASATNNNSINKGTPVIVSLTHNANNTTNGFKIYINGGNLATGTAKSSILRSGEELRIGRQKDISTRACKCYISELIMYDRVLKNKERETIEEYLGRKWFITLES